LNAPDQEASVLSFGAPSQAGCDVAFVIPT